MRIGRLLKFSLPVVLAGLWYGLLYRKLDDSQLMAAVQELRWRPMLMALLLFAPQTLVSAWRWRWLLSPQVPLTFSQAVRHTLAANAWNLLLPAKMGDLTKPAFFAEQVPGQRKHALQMALFEKGGDVACLVLWCGLGWLVICCLALPELTWMLGALASLGMLIGAGVVTWLYATSRMDAFRRRTDRYLAAGCVTGLLWGLHVTQLVLFLWATGVECPWYQALARMPMAVFAGLLPLSHCGLGTRDAAVVWLFADYATAERLAAVGILTALRYLVPGGLGIPWAIMLLRGKQRAAAPMSAQLPNGPSAASQSASQPGTPTVRPSSFKPASTTLGC